MKTKTFFRFFLLGVMTLFTFGAWAQTETPDKDYLCLTATEASSVTLNIYGRPKAVTIEYSTNEGKSWTTVDLDYSSEKTTTEEILLANVGDKVYFRNAKEAKDVTEFSSSNSKFYYFAMTGSIAASGNVMSLVDKSVATTTIPCTYCFAYLFDKCSALTNAADLKLPATELKNGCYYGMFNKCTGLETAPALPATTLANQCYHYMFKECTTLTAAPELKATTLAQSCCYGMFEGCIKLATAPTLPAETLAMNCYQNMFKGCTALTAAPELKATTLAQYCYYSMFEGCISLATAPTLPAEILEMYCYDAMFKGCKSLETAPELPATTLASSCYSYMFQGCEKLTAAPELPATTLESSCYSYMFGNCSALETAPALPATTLAASCYQSMFQGCTALKTAPVLSATALAKYCYSGMFYGCESLETAPVLPAETLVQSCYFQMFYDCKKLNFVKVGFKAWADNVKATSNWLENAGTEATTPTFECPAELDVDVETPRDVDHVPVGWTVKRAAVEVTIDDTTPYHAEKDTENATVTYTRTFAAEGQYEALYLPFSVTMTEDLMEKVTIAKIYMVSTKGSVVGGSQDAGVNVVVVKTLGEGESTKPHTPYFIRSEAGTDLEFTQENTTLYAATNAQPGHITCATTMDSYDFIGSYTGEELTPQAGSLIYLLQDGTLKNQTASVTLPCNRWKMMKTPTEWNDSYVAPVPQAKMLIVTLGEDETTGIEGLNLNENENENHNKAVYNLQGQRVGSFNGYRGIVIKGGKKFIVK